nr:MAG TPA: hypothetical protein [Caudoviricetes sp.]
MKVRGCVTAHPLVSSHSIRSFEHEDRRSK